LESKDEHKKGEGEVILSLVQFSRVNLNPRKSRCLSLSRKPWKSKASRAVAHGLLEGFPNERGCTSPACLLSLQPAPEQLRDPGQDPEAPRILSSKQLPLLQWVVLF
jgi:hypothetical protein